MTESEKERLRALEVALSPMMASIAEHMAGEMGVEMPTETAESIRAQMLGIPMAALDALFAIRDGAVWRGMPDPQAIAGRMVRDMGFADESWTDLEAFAARFDKNTPHWSNEQEVNKLFIRSVNNYLNDKLKIRGHVFLNEVLDELGLPRTARSQVVGWHISSGNPIRILGGEFDDEGGINLVFNVDGYILDKIDG